MRFAPKMAIGIVGATMIASSADALVIYETNRSVFEASIPVADTEDFEGLGVGAGAIVALGNPLVLGNFTFTASSGVVVGLGAGVAGALTSAGAAADLFSDTLDIAFSVPVMSFGFDATATSSATAGISIYGLGNALLGSTTLAINSASMSFLGIQSDQQITHVLFDNAGGLPGPILDDLVIDNPAAVPLPASFVLLLAGGGVLGAAARRRRKAV